MSLDLSGISLILEIGRTTSQQKQVFIEAHSYNQAFCTKAKVFSLSTFKKQS